MPQENTETKANGTEEAPESLVTMSHEDLQALAAEAIEQMRARMSGEGTEGDTPTQNFVIVSDAARGVSGDGAAVDEPEIDFTRKYDVRQDVHRLAMARDEGRGFIEVDDEDSIRVGTPRDMQGYTGACLHTFRLIKARAKRDYEEQHRLVQRMERAGMYDEYRQRQGVTDTQGVPFLPTAIADRIDVIREQVGVARQFCTVFNLTRGTLRVPGVQGVIEMSAVNENSDIPGKGFSTESIDLDPEKWGGIHPFTTEMEEEVGAQYIDNVIEAAGVGFAKAEDETVFTADGTAAYHSITGLLNDGDIGEHVISGTDFTDLTYDDWLTGMETVAPVLFDRLRTFFNPFLQFTFHRMEDNGGKIYPFGSGLPNTLAWTEALPGSGDSAADTSFGVAGDLSFVHMAILRDVTVDILREGTVTDSDSNSVNLALQDALALRFTARWDVGRNDLADDAFTKYTTASGT